MTDTIRSSCGWRWLLFLLPAAEAVLVWGMSPRLSSFLSSRAPSSFYLSTRHDAQIGFSMMNLPIVIVLSLAIGIWACWERPFRVESSLSALGFGLVVAVGNLFVAFVCCLVGATVFDF